MIYYVFPTSFDSRLEIKNVSFTFEQNVNEFLFSSKKPIRLNIKKLDVLMSPFRVIEWENNEVFTWRNHEIEEVEINWTGDISGQCEVWNDYLTSAQVGLLSDFIPNSLPKEVEDKIRNIGFHWRFQSYADSLTSLDCLITAILVSTLAKLCDGIIMIEAEESEEGFEPYSPETFLQTFSAFNTTN